MPTELPEDRDKARQAGEKLAQRRQGKGLSDGRWGVGATTPDFEEHALSLPVDASANTGPIQAPDGSFYPDPLFPDD